MVRSALEEHTVCSMGRDRIELRRSKYDGGDVKAEGASEEGSLGI